MSISKNELTKKKPKMDELSGLLEQVNIEQVQSEQTSRIQKGAQFNSTQLDTIAEVEEIEEEEKQEIVPGVKIMSNANMIIPTANFQRNNELVPEQKVIDKWNKRFTRNRKGEYFRESKLGKGKVRKYFQVNDDEKQWNTHSRDFVEFNFEANMLQSLSPESLSERWKGKSDLVPDGGIPSREQIAGMRKQLLTDIKESYDNTLISGEETGQTYMLLKKMGKLEDYRLMDLTIRYYQYQEIKEQMIEDMYSSKRRKAFKGQAGINVDKHTYEHQRMNNCYACAGAKIVNWAVNGNDSKYEDILNQHKIRNFVPRYLSEEENEALNPGAEADIEKLKRDVGLFAGEGKTALGNIAAISDVIFDAEKYGGAGRRDLALHKKTFRLQTVNNKVIRSNMIEAMKKQIKDVLDTGQMVAMLTHVHYITITDIKDGKVKYLNSSNAPANELTEASLDSLLKGYSGYDSVEMNWVSKIDENSLDDMKKKYKGLGIDEKTGEVIRTNGIMGAEDVAHRAGIDITRSYDEIVEDGDEDIVRYMSESVIVHRGAFMGKEQFEARFGEEGKRRKVQQPIQNKDQRLRTDREQSEERQRNLEEEKQRELEEQRQRDIREKQRELEEQKQRDLEAQNQRELEEQKQREFEVLNQRNIEEKQKEIKKQKELKKQRELEEKQKELEEQKQRELEEQKQRELEEQKQRDLDEQKREDARRKDLLKDTGEYWSMFDTRTKEIYDKQVQDYLDQSQIKNIDLKTNESKQMRRLQVLFDGEKSLDETVMKSVMILQPVNMEAPDIRDMGITCFLIEDLVGKILSVDVEKEFAGTNAGDYMGVYEKYDQLFLAANGLNWYLDQLQTVVSSGKLSTALTTEDIEKVKMRLATIDSYGKYYIARVNGDTDVKLPEKREENLSEEDVQRMRKAVEEKWKSGEADAMLAIRKSIEEKRAGKREEEIVNRFRLAMHSDTVEDTKHMAFSQNIAMANGDDDEEACRIYRGLGLARKKDKSNASDEEKREFVEAAEKVFYAVLSFDFSKIREGSVLDFYADNKLMNRFFDLKKMLPDVNEILNDYAELKMEGVNFDENALDMVKSRCELFDKAGDMIRSKSTDVEQRFRPESQDYHSDSEEKTKEFEEQYLKENAEEIKKLLENVEHAFWNKEVAENEKEYALNEKMTEAKAYTTRGLLSLDTLFGQFSQHFTLRGKLTNSMREEEMGKKGSELNKKQIRMKSLIQNANKARDVVAKGRRNISFSVRMNLDDEVFRAASAFFGDDQEKNIDLVRKLSGRGSALNARNLTEQEKRDNRTAAMNMLTMRFLNEPESDINLSSDDELMLGAERLEGITMKVKAFKILLEQDEEYRKRLSETKVGGENGGEESMLDRVMRKMDRLGMISDYYRAKKLVLTDSYYLSHFDDEISLDDKKADPEQKRMAKLLNLSKSTALSLIKRFGDDHQDIEKATKPGEWMNSGTAAALDSIEEECTERVYADGKMDLTLITKDSINKLIDEINDFHDHYAKRDYINRQYLLEHWEEFQELIKGYSPMFKNLISAIYAKNNFKLDIESAERHTPGLYGKLSEWSKGSNERLRGGLDTSLSFMDNEKGERLAYGSNFMREFALMARIASSHMMSKEEILELVEGTMVSNWQDLDKSDPEQMVKARDYYLKNTAKLFKMYYHEQRRCINTYGLMMIQLPPLALSLAMGKNSRDYMIRTTALGNGIGDMLSARSTLRDGKMLSLLDILVREKLLSPEFAQRIRNDSEMLMYNSMSAVGNCGEIYWDYMTDDDIEKNELEIQSVTDPQGSSIQRVNAHRKDPDSGPQIPVEQEEKAWEMCNRLLLAKGMQKQCVDHQRVNNKAIMEQKNYTDSMVRLEEYVRALNDVETGGHSKKYKVFAKSLHELRSIYSMIARSHPADGKNLDPDGMFQLRKAYADTIQAASVYLKKKNLKHRNRKYRERYKIVGDLLETMKSDYNVLNKLSPDRCYNLGEALEESRATVITVNEGDVETMHGALSQRNVFTQEIDGQSRKLVFTRHKNLEKDMADVSSSFVEFSKDFEKLSGGNTKWKAFPELATFALFDNGSMEFDSFFQEKTTFQILKRIYDKRKKNRSGNRSEQAEAAEFAKDKITFRNSFEKFLNRISTDRMPKQLKKASPQYFGGGNTIAKAYAKMKDEVKENILDHMLEIGETWLAKNRPVFTYQNAGIPIGSNIDKRNVAMSIMANQLGTDQNIAHSTLGNVTIKGRIEEPGEPSDGVLMEYVDGIKIEDVRKGFRDGTIIADNEADLMEQLSDLQVTDYLCANFDRHMGNVIFKMEDTGKVTETGESIRRIKKIVGIDNDLSFGNVRASQLTKHEGGMSIPETMSFVSRKLANRILGLSKDRVFLMLAGNVTEEEKEAMWTRVEHMQIAIMNAETSGKKGGLKIIDHEDFADIRLLDVANSNYGNRNIFSLLSAQTNGFGKKAEKADKEKVPHRMSADEVRLEIKTGGMAMADKKGMFVSMDSIELGEILAKNAWRNNLKDTDHMNRHYKQLRGAAKEFDTFVGTLFDQASSNRSANNITREYMDMFSNSYAKKHGIDSILDIFYIGDKSASELLKDVVNTTVDKLIKNPSMLSRILQIEAGKKLPAKLSEDEMGGIRDLVAKAYIMSYVVRGDQPVTLATFQKRDSDGTDELVLTDLNPVLEIPQSKRFTDTQHASSDGQSRMIENSRMNREKRHGKISEQMQKKWKVSDPDYKSHEPKNMFRANQVVDSMIKSIGFDQINSMINTVSKKRIPKTVAKDQRKRWEKSCTDMAQMRESVYNASQKKMTREKVLEEIERRREELSRQVEEVDRVGIDAVRERMWAKAGASRKKKERVTNEELEQLYRERKAELKSLDQAAIAVKSNRVSIDTARLWLDRKQIQNIGAGSILNEALKSKEADQQQSDNSFVTEMLTESAVLAAMRVKKSKSAKVNLKDRALRHDTRRIFRELCIMNGIEPRTMERSF